MPQVQAELTALAGLSRLEARAIWNGGIGLVAVVEAAAAEPATEFLNRRGLSAWLIGDVIAQRGEHRYIEERLP